DALRRGHNATHPFRIPYRDTRSKTHRSVAPAALAGCYHRSWISRGARVVDFRISERDRRLQRRCRELAVDFATRAAAHDRDASQVKRHLAELVVGQKQLIAGNFSEAGTTSLIGERPLGARARRVDGGWRITGRKMFASMLEAADYCMVMTYPEAATGPYAGI